MISSFNSKYFKIKRSLQSMDTNDLTLFENIHYSIGDIINENVLSSPYKLLNDVVNQLKCGKTEIRYDKNDLIELSDKDWKYFKFIDKIPTDKFSLTVVRCSKEQCAQKFQNISFKNVSMCEFVNPDNCFDEYIWINSEDENNFQYGEDFKNLLKHELGHVWTFIFGTLNDDFKDGQGPSNGNNVLKPLNFNHFQKDVFMHLYNKNLNILQFDFNYILCKFEGDQANFELPTHTDNIIEILIADYFEIGIDNPTEYLQMVWNTLQFKKDYSLKNLNLLKHYCNNVVYTGYNSIKSVKNPIRRLFLIFAFGTDEQINYFKTACEDEFGKI